MLLADIKDRIARENTIFEVDDNRQNDVIRLALISTIEKLNAPIISVKVTAVTDQKIYTIPAEIRIDKVVSIDELIYKINYNKIEFATPPTIDFYVYGLPSVNSVTMETVVSALPDDYEDVLDAYIDYWIAAKQKLDTAPTLLQIADMMAYSKKKNIDTTLNINLFVQGMARQTNYNLDEGF